MAEVHLRISLPVIPRFSRRALLACALFTTMIAPGATADFPTDQVAVALAPGDLAIPYSGGVLLFTPDGTRGGIPNLSLESYGAHAVVFDSSRRLYFSRRYGGPAPLETEIWTTDTTRASTLPFGGRSLVFDVAGNLYVGDEFISKYSPSGMLIRNFASPPWGLWDIDLAADQCTMFIASSAGPGHRFIARHDVCRDVVLPDVPVPPSTFSGLAFGSEIEALRILPDGSLLVAAGPRALRIDTNGNVLATYTIPSVNANWVALALNSTGTEFWVGVEFFGLPRNLFRLNLASGLVVAGPFDTTGIPIRSLAVAGEHRAALAPAATIPTLSPLALIAIACALAIVALRALS